MWAGIIAMVIFGLGLMVAIIAEPEADMPMTITVIPAMPQYSPTVITRQDCLCDDCCYEEAYIEYFDEFTALFNSYETKRAKNGALMIRRGNSGSYRFAKKG